MATNNKIKRAKYFHKEFKRRKKIINQKNELLSKIRKFDDPILQQICDNVKIEENFISLIIDELTRALYASKNGVGLAAPQIGYTKKIIAIRPDVESTWIKILINPEIIDKSKETILMKEGCLSFPGVIAEVERNKFIKVSYIDERFRKTEEDIGGLKSIIIQHEIDHLNGKCYNYDEYIKLKMGK
jgi:peptide deformylase